MKSKNLVMHKGHGEKEFYSYQNRDTIKNLELRMESVLLFLNTPTLNMNGIFLN